MNRVFGDSLESRLERWAFLGSNKQCRGLELISQVSNTIESADQAIFFSFFFEYVYIAVVPAASKRNGLSSHSYVPLIVSSFKKVNA